MKINFIGSTEPGSFYDSSSVSTLTNSVADTPPLTVIEIENPHAEHILIGTKGPNQRESDAITRALDWLAEKRSSDYGWNNDTHMVILAKEVCILMFRMNKQILFMIIIKHSINLFCYFFKTQLSGQRDFTESTDAHIQIIQDLEDMLSTKQMTIEILSLIDHHHHAVMPKSYNVADLARYALALGALCKDPKHFMNQHDLLAMLQHHESNDDHNFALSTLAVCSLGEHVRKRQIRQLIDIALENNQNIGKFTLKIYLEARIEINLSLNSL